MLDKMRDARFGRWIAAGAVAAAVTPVAAGTAAAADKSDRTADSYQLVQRTQVGSTTAAHAAKHRKTGPAAARHVNRVAKRLKARGYDLECRVYTTRLGGLGVIECKGSIRAKRELSRQIRRLVRQGKIISPEASGYYFGPWSTNSNREVRIDWARFGYYGIPA
jgi:hypothetical protein